MKPNPEHTDPFDAELQALLAEDAADARQAPAELEAKVLALTDPHLVSLLDEALAPEHVPAGLSERILAATLAGQRSQPTVLARIGLGTWRYAAAAAIALAGTVGLWWVSQQGDTTNPNPEVAAINPDHAADIVLPEYVTSSPIFTDSTASVEAKLQNVSDRIDSYAIDSDAIWSDMDGYEQFLSDFETDT